MQQWLINLATNHEYFVYFITVIFACVEGPVLSMIFGLLLRFGYFNFFLIYLALMLGDLLGDAVWYYIGFRFGHPFIKRFGKYFSITEHGVEKVKEIFHKHNLPILFISKITNGFGFALVTLITAGVAKLPFGKYLSINLIGQFVWTGLLLGIGYFFGNLYVTVDTIIGRSLITALFAIVFVAFLGYKKYLKQKAESMNL